MTLEELFNKVVDLRRSHPGTVPITMSVAIRLGGSAGLMIDAMPVRDVCPVADKSDPLALRTIRIIGENNS